MAKIIANAPHITCPSCGATIEYTEKDIQYKNEQYWGGFFKGGWLNRTKRILYCPGCGKGILLGHNY